MLTTAPYLGKCLKESRGILTPCSFHGNLPSVQVFIFEWEQRAAVLWRVLLRVHPYTRVLLRAQTWNTHATTVKKRHIFKCSKMSVANLVCKIWIRENTLLLPSTFVCWHLPWSIYLMMQPLTDFIMAIFATALSCIQYVIDSMILECESVHAVMVWAPRQPAAGQLEYGDWVFSSGDISMPLYILLLLHKQLGLYKTIYLDLFTHSFHFRFIVMTQGHKASLRSLWR